MSPLRILGLAGLLVLALLAVIGPDITGFDPARQDLRAILVPPGTDGHILGTDHLGRDLAARLVEGARITLALAAFAVASAALVGVGLGILAGWTGGAIDGALVTLSNGVLALPGLLLVLLMAAIVPDSWWTLYAGLALTLWVEFFRLSRTRSKVILRSPAVEAARTMGLPRAHIVSRHLWPDLSPQILSLAAFGAATAVTALATLGFISVGLRPPTPEWGIMMSELLPSWRIAPWAIGAPILALAFTVLSLRLAAGSQSETEA